MPREIMMLKQITMRLRNVFKSFSLVLTMFLLLAMVACDDEEESPPVLITKQAEEITSSSVVTGGTIIEEGSYPITGRGVAYSRSERYPVLEDNYVAYDGDEHDFEVLLEDLNSNTVYFIRAYAENEAGVISFGASLSFTTN